MCRNVSRHVSNYKSIATVYGSNRGSLFRFVTTLVKPLFLRGKNGPLWLLCDLSGETEFIIISDYSKNILSIVEEVQINLKLIRNDSLFTCRWHVVGHANIP